MNYLVYDIGGTFIRAGVYCKNSYKLVDMLKVLTPCYKDFDNGNNFVTALLSTIKEISEYFFPQQYPHTVGIGFAGPIDGRGEIVQAPTVWGPNDSSFKLTAAKLSNLWPLSKVHILNDVSAAGFRYVSQGVKDFCLITISSGVGHKVFVNGNPLVGIHGGGGEVGHLRILHQEASIKCECGGEDHIGAICSGRGAVAVAQKRIRDNPKDFQESFIAKLNPLSATDITTKDIVVGFKNNDPWCCSLIDYSTRIMGQVIASIHLLIGIEKFIIIGGFALALGEKYIEKLSLYAKQNCWDTLQDWAVIIQAGESDDLDGLLGMGAYLILQEVKNDC